MTKTENNTDLLTFPLSSSSEHPAGESPQTRRRDFFALTDASKAEAFASLHADDVRFDHNRDRWMTWSRHWWVEDQQDKVVLKAKTAARWRAADAKSIENKQRCDWAYKSESRARLDSMLKLAQAEPPISDTGREWDASPWLLGVANGVLDLTN